MEITGLVARCEFNGRVGNTATLSNSGRWTVALEGGDAKISVKVANLVIAKEEVPFDGRHHRDLMEAKGIHPSLQFKLSSRKFKLSSDGRLIPCYDHLN